MPTPFSEPSSSKPSFATCQVDHGRPRTTVAPRCPRAPAEREFVVVKKHSLIFDHPDFLTSMAKGTGFSFLAV
jgi:hypothetical protein